MSIARRFGLSALFLSAAVLPAAAQARFMGDADILVAPSYLGWRFKDPILSDSFSVRKAWQFAVPVSASVRAGRITLDASAAWANGQVGLEDGRSFSLSGLTDLRMRAVARVIGDRLLITAGLNLPVGATRLSGHQIDALGVLGASALGFSSPALGNGLGGTGGVVYAFTSGGWGVGLGASYEARSQYTPIEAQLAGVEAPADFSPGNALRFSLGADRVVGQGRVSLLVAGDVYAESRLSIAPSGAAPIDSRFTLGPQFSGSLLLDLGVSGMRSFRVSIADRYRTRFTGLNGKKADGSSGNIFEAALELVKGGSRGAGLYLRADGRLDSGLEVDNTITTAAMTAGGLSVGVAVLSGRASVLPFIRAQIGRIDTGLSATTAIGYGAGVTLTVRP